MKSEDIKQQGKILGFHKVGIASIQSETEAVELQEWLEKGYHAEMEWMKNPKRGKVNQCMEGVRSIISVALNYYTPHQRPEGKQYGKISRYGWGRDYHKIMKGRLKAFSAWLESQSPEIKTRYYADTGPIQDKVWAQRAGLGWIAKNSNLITREFGSWVFIGEILTNLDLKTDSPHTQHCGTCTKCISACPTGAIVEPFVVDANRCLAYHTIENRDEELPEAIVKNLGGWVAGCDVCQDVCPWNERFAVTTNIEDFHPYPHNLAPSLEDLTNLSHQEWDQRFTSSALRRIKPQMWRRNALANLKCSQDVNPDDD